MILLNIIQIIDSKCFFVISRSQNCEAVRLGHDPNWRFCPHAEPLQTEENQRVVAPLYQNRQRGVALTGTYIRFRSNLTNITIITIGDVWNSEQVGTTVMPRIAKSALSILKNDTLEGRGLFEEHT